MNYLVIDLEMCKVPKLYRRSYQYSSEIIQIGAWNKGKTFGKCFQLDRPYGLAEALESADIKQEGHFHDGLDDAVNTGLLIEKLETNPEFQLVRYELPKMSEGLGCTLAEIMAKLQVEIEESQNRKEDR